MPGTPPEVEVALGIALAASVDGETVPWFLLLLHPGIRLRRAKAATSAANCLITRIGLSCFTLSPREFAVTTRRCRRPGRSTQRRTSGHRLVRGRHRHRKTSSSSKLDGAPLHIPRASRANSERACTLRLSLSPHSPQPALQERRNRFANLQPDSIACLPYPELRRRCGMYFAQA